MRNIVPVLLTLAAAGVPAAAFAAQPDLTGVWSISSHPAVLKTVANWNPVSTVTQAAREGFGNTSPKLPPMRNITAL